MRLPGFEFHEPTSVASACEVMGRLREKARLLAGGTDLIVNMKKKVIRPDHVVSLGRIDILKGIIEENGHLTIGACVTAAELAGAEVIRESLAALADGAAVLGSPLIRNLATVAGNLVSARPAADLPPPLMVYDAQTVLIKATGERSVDLNGFFLGPGKTLMEPDEILTGITIEMPKGCYGDSYIKLGVRQTLEISLVNVAAFIQLNGAEGSITKARIVLGAVGPTPLRAISAEEALMGQSPSDALFARAGEAAAGDAKPIDDFRGSAEYRRDMVAVLTKRALNAALDRARSR